MARSVPVSTLLFCLYFLGLHGSLSLTRGGEPDAVVEQVTSSSHSDISPVKSEGAHESSDSPTPGFILDGNEGEGEGMEEDKEESETSEETALSKGCAQALDEKTEMTICQDFGLVA